MIDYRVVERGWERGARIEIGVVYGKIKRSF